LQYSPGLDCLPVDGCCCANVAASNIIGQVFRTSGAYVPPPRCGVIEWLRLSGNLRSVQPLMLGCPVFHEIVSHLTTIE
jgi:hypothetical protein